MEKIGLVLAGGGGRGAYQIGVWKALNETGLDQYVASVSGTSVGGLNAALFLQGDIKRAIEIWENISVEKILTPRHGYGTAIQDYTYKQVREHHGDLYMYIRSGLLEIIDKNLDMSVFDQSEMNCYMSCRRSRYKKDMYCHEEMFTYPDGAKGCKKYVEGQATYFNMRGFSYEERRNILLATSAMPFIFPQEKIGGYYYMDGGSVDNLPVEPLYRLEGCRMIIVIHLTTNDGKMNYDRFPDAKILEIRPMHEQGGLFAGILDFHVANARRRIEQGYADNIEMFQAIREDIDRGDRSMRQLDILLEKERRAAQLITVGWNWINKQMNALDNRKE